MFTVYLVCKYVLLSVRVCWRDDTRRILLNGFTQGRVTSEGTPVLRLAVPGNPRDPRDSRDPIVR